MKVRVGLDLDGVVADWSGEAVRLLNVEKGYSLKADSPYWDYIKDNVSPKDWRWLWNEAITDEKLFLKIWPLPGASKEITEIAKVSDILVMTNRPVNARLDTLRWLEKWRFSAPKEIHFFDYGESKSSVRADIYVDDSHKNATDLLSHGLNVWLMKASHNEGLDFPYRVGTLGEFRRKVYDLYESFNKE